jgi:cleavage and polyadenylation specificity factor subunit 4
MTVATTNPLTVPGPLQDIVKPHFHQVLLPAESFIKNDLGLKLDKGNVLDLLTVKNSTNHL